MAYIAEYNVKQCEMNHDSCRNTQDGQYSGQNLYWGGFQGTADIRSHIRGSVEMWYSEVQHAVAADINSFGSATDWYKIGHFSQLAWGTNPSIGCAVSTYSGNPWNSVLIACNYGPGNWMGEAIYQAGPAGSSCRTRDSVFTSLCTS